MAIELSGTYLKLEGSDEAMSFLGALNERERHGTLVSRESGGERPCSVPEASGCGLLGRIGGGLFMSQWLSCQAHSGTERVVKGTHMLAGTA